nr:hypothetical protein [uncultured Marinifilum sp.]
MQHNTNTKENSKIFKDNKAAAILFEDYIGTELYSEIIKFNDDSFPGWRLNHQLGEFAPLFILFIIDYQKEHFVGDNIEEFLFLELKIIYNQYKAYKLANKTHKHRQIQTECMHYLKNNSIKNIELNKIASFADGFFKYFENIIYWSY